MIENSTIKLKKLYTEPFKILASSKLSQNNKNKSK